MIPRSQIKILFLNQMAGPLFRELAEDLSEAIGPSLLYTGHRHTARRANTINLKISAGPEYDRRNNISRLLSWCRFAFKAFFTTARQSKRSILFIVSNPPFLGILGFLFKLLRHQKYVILVYDIYPEILIALRMIHEGYIARFWRYLNRFIYEHADLVFTIGTDMAAKLNHSYDLRRTAAGQAIVINNWADIETIKPIEKKDNWFAVQHKQIGKTTVLYSGNMGNAHDIESILEAARRLQNDQSIHFLLIGEGAKWKMVERTIVEKSLTNVTLLPFQSEEVLPYSLAAGDIGIVAYVPGTEEFMVPSKTYYYMAAGVVPLIVCGKETELSRTILEHACGRVVSTPDIDAMVHTIQELGKNLHDLSVLKQSARSIAERLFSRNNTAQFVHTMERYVTGARF